MGVDYIDNARFEELVVEAQRTGVVSNELADMFGKIGANLLNRYRFQGISRDEGYSEAAYVLLAKYNNYKPGKGKFFNYATTVVLNHFRSLWRREDIQNGLIEKVKIILMEEFRRDKYKSI